MSKKKAIGIAGIVIAILGVVLLFFAGYINSEVAEGRQKIKSAQTQVDQGKSLFSLTPATKDVGDGLASPIQKKIDEGKDQVQYYSALASKLQVFGIILIVIGAIAIAYGFFNWTQTGSKKR